MNRKVKSLVEICQDVVGRHIDGVTGVGDIPFWLLERSLRRANGDQLSRIEAYNPHLMDETEPGLWLNVCRAEFKDIRDNYKDGDEPGEASTWRGVYMKRKKERDRKIAESQKKVRDAYKNHHLEKQARSVVVIDHLIPRTKHSSGGIMKKRGNSSIFQKSLIQTKKHSLIYNNDNTLYPSSPSRRAFRDSFLNSIPSVISIGPRISSKTGDAIAKYKSSAIPTNSSKSIKRSRSDSTTSPQALEDMDGVTRFFAELSPSDSPLKRPRRTSSTTTQSLSNSSSSRPGVIVRRVSLPAESNFFKEVLGQ